MVKYIVGKYGDFMIKTVFLDLDDTILDFGKGERKALRHCFEMI